ncbi:hypothetical protein CHLNCDRAFT_24871 [Chlorella variabilis]|uniref:Partial AB-hydrolase lipase domain-containing protein n=1 Tax=Chlorella variabilis TaxID=554065 RepID=E1ZII9_CHLVA|nr:hypothetical protein CHLNCDRAFT_24871 [Chlorella variabilis]EFN54341.1 hypothetical protein CHLNCDRAFT_24871 [Chlorella variabilis]|eukprot:XP_005846443.1 hypothetical protein CHLNCDRAFT_24871 [Chlorella variabilis]
MEAAAAAAAAAAEGSAATARAPRRRALRPPLKSLLRSGRHWEEDLSVWTASDVILREGYPLEQHSVTTSDGYVLQMHRIPRHGGRDVVFFQHGVLDTSLGWVANGVVGSAAFAAFDAGFDVWLGNSRSNAPRLHMDAEKQGSRYWRYRCLVGREEAAVMPQQQGQGQGQGPSSSSSNAAGAAGQDVLPYRLQAVGHSLGAATLLIYAVGSRMRGQPHRLRRLILMSPAGFHPTGGAGRAGLRRSCTRRHCSCVLPAAGDLPLFPDPVLLPTTAPVRLPQDLRHMPALHDLVKAGMRMMMSGDSSQWDAALQMPHYSTYSMPALSLHSGAHFAQWSNDLSFRLFDYGTAAANRERYGTDRPPSIADHYRLLDIPVDLLAGAADGIIPPACVIRHVHHLRAAAVPCSFRILPLGHMDFTLAVKDDIRLFVLAKLRQPLP